MLVDIVVNKGQILAAKPKQSDITAPPPIILVRTESGSVLPVVKWYGYESYSMRERLANRIFGKLKRGALKQAFRIVRNNGGLDISGENGSLEVQDDDFMVDSGLQKEMNPNSEYKASPDFAAKEQAMLRSRKPHVK